MQITIKGLKIDGNKQLKQVVKLDKEMKKLINKRLKSFVKGCEFLWDETNVKNCDLRHEKHNEIGFLSFLWNKDGNLIEQDGKDKDGNEVIGIDINN